MLLITLCCQEFPLQSEINFTFLFIIDMQKFPLRMKDNDLLVTELYKDPANDMVTALSVYLTPKTSMFIWSLLLIWGICKE